MITQVRSLLTPRDTAHKPHGPCTDQRTREGRSGKRTAPRPEAAGLSLYPFPTVIFVFSGHFLEGTGAHARAHRCAFQTLGVPPRGQRGMTLSPLHPRFVGSPLSNLCGCFSNRNSKATAFFPVLFVSFTGKRYGNRVMGISLWCLRSAVRGVGVRWGNTCNQDLKTPAATEPGCGPRPCVSLTAVEISYQVHRPTRLGPGEGRGQLREVSHQTPRVLSHPRRSVEKQIALGSREATMSPTAGLTQDTVH